MFTRETPILQLADATDDIDVFEVDLDNDDNDTPLDDLLKPSL